MHGAGPVRLRAEGEVDREVGDAVRGAGEAGGGHVQGDHGGDEEDERVLPLRTGEAFRIAVLSPVAGDAALLRRVPPEQRGGERRQSLQGGWHDRCTIDDVV